MTAKPLKTKVTMKPLKTKVSITLDEDVIDEIRKYAEAEERSFSNFINLVLKEYLKSCESEKV